MAFGQSAGPPASAKQVAYLLSLLEAAGFGSFREARHPFGLTQRQAGGKFTRPEASALIDRLLAGETEISSQERLAIDDDASVRRLDRERSVVVLGLPAEVMADELARRGWSCTPPD